jgi:hypothetical protein
MVRNRIARAGLLLTFFVFAAGISGGRVFAQTTFYFPQIADGGAFTTTIFITNPGQPSTTANVTITLNGSNGTPMSTVTFVDNLGGSQTGTISLTLAGGRSRRLVSTASSGTTLTGFATVTSDIPVTGSAVFSQFNGAPQSGSLVGEAGVTGSSALTGQAIFVDETNPFTTALAYANPSQTSIANVNFNLLDTNGVQVQSTATVLLPMRHGALFVNQLFTASPVTNHVGTMQIVSDNPVATVSLRFAGSLFTSVPPFSLASLVSPVVTPLGQWLGSRTLPAPLAAFAKALTAFRSSAG